MIRRLLVLVTALVLVTPVLAQTGSGPLTEEAARSALSPVPGAAVAVAPRAAAGNATLLAGPIDPGHYRLGPGDVLSLELSGRTERRTELVVDAEGRLRVPEMAVLAVGGRTLQEVRNQVLGRLRGIYSGVRVDLRLVGVRAFKIYIAGQVQSPGVSEATAATRASEVLRGSLALLPDASRRNLVLRRAGGKEVRVDLDAFSFLGRTEDNPYLEDGDVLIVPSRAERVFALGAFARPGEYERAPGDRLSDLVELAGGLLAGADSTTARLVRFVGAQGLDSMSVVLGSVAPTEDVVLQHEDRLFVRQLPEYRRGRNVTVAGEVNYPGPYAIREGEDRLSGALARAGGLTAWAAGERILVFRPVSTQGQRDIEFERLSRLARSEMTDAEYQTFKTKLASQQAAYIVDSGDLLRGAGEFDVLLKDGDVIVVDRAMQAVRVAGEVQRPSLLEYRPGRGGREYIALAGGFTRRADSGKVRLTRAGSNQTIALAEAREVLPGDFIWVPEKKDVNFWAALKDVLLVAGSVATIVILLRGN